MKVYLEYRILERHDHGSLVADHERRAIILGSGGPCCVMSKYRRSRVNDDLHLQARYGIVEGISTCVFDVPLVASRKMPRPPLR